MPTALETLLDASAGTKVSIYMPTHRSGPETTTDHAKLEKALDEAKEKLTANGMSGHDADAMLEQANTVVRQENFWQHSADGLACFIAKGEDGPSTRFVQLDGETPTVTVIADTFHLRPLLLTAARDGEFHVLTITRDKVSLYRGDADGLTPVEPAGMITGIEDVTWKTDYDQQTGFHADGRSGGIVGGGFDAGRGGAGQDGAPRYHSFGISPEDYDDIEFEKFLSRVAKDVEAELVNSNSPLVVIADPRTVGWYKNESTYRHLAGDVQKNPQDFTLADMHEAAWKIVRPHLNKERNADLERLEGRLASGDEPATNELSSLVQAAAEGRVDTLFLARHGEGATREWGHWDADKRTVSFSDEASGGAQDLINLAAVETMKNGGKVMVMPEDKAGDLGQAAAILRF